MKEQVISKDQGCGELKDVAMQPYNIQYIPETTSGSTEASRRSEITRYTASNSQYHDGYKNLKA